nr:YcaO-like family protein [Clavibacter sp. VKM Ac-2872]
MARGKGATDAEALASCLGAALERYTLGQGTHPLVVEASALELEGAVDVERVFGLAHVDAPLGMPHSMALSREWMPAVDILEGRSVYVPAALAIHRHDPRRASQIAPSDAGGAACRASAVEAFHLGLREVVERDAFQYYARTEALPTPLGWALVPEDVRDAMSAVDARFSVTLLDNPFDAPVVTVAMVCGASHRARASFGSAFASTLSASVRDAFLECMSMLHSLDARVAIAPRDTDMRNLWFTGSAVDALPGLFPDMHDGPEVGVADLGLHERHELRQLLIDAEAQGMSVFDIPLVEERGIAVHKVVMSGTALEETTCSSPSRRLQRFAMFLGHPAPRLRYGGPLVV